MPQRAQRVCARPGCGALTDATYCQAHLAEQLEAVRGSASARGYDRRWRRLRLIVLRRDPLCKIGSLCHGDAPSTEADHIIPKARGGDDSMENLQGACHPCHSRKTATEDSAFARKQKG